MFFEELRGEINIMHLVEYYAKFGTEHLHAPAHELNFISSYDLDIKLLILLTVLGLTLGFYLIITECLCKKRKQ